MPLRALVVDDSRAMRGILSKILMRVGFEVLQAGDGREAIAALAEAVPPVDVVLSDWNMREMNGLEFLRVVRASPRLAKVMVTTETHIEQMRKPSPPAQTNTS